MGEFVISAAMTAFVWLISLGVIAINLYIVGGFLVDAGNASDNGGEWLYAGTGAGAFLYLGFTIFLMREDLQKLKQRLGSMVLKLGGYDFVGGHDVVETGSHHIPGRAQRVPSEDGDSLEFPDPEEVATGGSGPGGPGSNKRPLSGVGQDYAPVSMNSGHDPEGVEQRNRPGGVGGAGDTGRGVEGGDDAQA